MGEDLEALINVVIRSGTNTLHGDAFVFAQTGRFNAEPGSNCTFETLMHRFAITEPAVMSASHVVHVLDLKETRYAIPEGAAISRIVDGLRAAYADDHELLQSGIVVMDALYRSFASDGDRRNGRRKRRRPATGSK